MILRVVGLLLALLSLVTALSVTGGKLLVILDEDSEKSKYSQFWTDLQDRGFQITYHSPKDTSLSLFLHGEPAYSHLLLLPSKSKGLGPALTPNLLVDFVNHGSNILLALSSEYAVSSAISSLLLELDISLAPDRNNVVVDHFNYDDKSAGEQHDVLLLPGPDFKGREIENFFAVENLIAMPHAVGQVLGNASPLLASVLRAPSTAYIHNPKEDADSTEEAFATGSQINLVSAFQARNSARLTVLGSAEALEDKWFTSTVQLPGSNQKASNTGNRAFAQQLSAWTFKELGVLKVNSIQHKLKDDSSPNDASDLATHPTTELSNPSIYRIKQNVHYSVSISAWSHDHWTTFTPPAGDNLQLEISMLSPFHRLNLRPVINSNNKNATTYHTTFPLPDQHGIFNFFLEYRRPFYTNLEEKRTVTVRHFAHDEWPRSFVISGAYPWIGGIGVTVAGWLGFVGLWLFSRPSKPQRDLKIGVAGKR